jgi:DNA-directed RNA polymerase subunit N (RpoN/RPB10)
MSCIPVKCFTCARVIAQWKSYYDDRVKMLKNTPTGNTNTGGAMADNDVKYLTLQERSKTVEASVLDEMNMMSYCCRRHFLTHVDIV